MLETRCVGDNYKKLVTVWPFWSPTSTIFFIEFKLVSGTNIQKMQPKYKFCHQHLKSSSTSSHQQLDVTKSTVTGNSGFCYNFYFFILKMLHLIRNIRIHMIFYTIGKHRNYYKINTFPSPVFYESLLNLCEIELNKISRL